MMYDVIVFENFCFCPSTQNEKPAFSKIFALESVFEKICLRWLFSPNRLAKLEKKISTVKQKWLRVERAF